MSEKSKNRLGLNLFDANLKRHPSVKGLFDKDGKIKIPTNAKDEFLLLNVENKSEKESNDTSNNNGEEENEEKGKKKPKRRTMSVNINRVQDKMVDNKETFFVEMNDKEMREFIKSKPNKNVKSEFVEPLNYEFTDNQKKFDKDITEAMSRGKEYSEIEGKFIDQLKKK